MEEDRRLGLGVELLEHRARERLVHGARSPPARRGAAPGRRSARRPAPTGSAAGTTASGSPSRCRTSRRPLVVHDEAHRYADPSRACSSNASPPASAATPASSSLIALAIHVTSWCATRLRSAVTSPPPPRRATLFPPASDAYDTGPRLETTISFHDPPPGHRPKRHRRSVRRNGRDLGTAGVVALEPVQQREPVAQEPRREEVPAHELLAAQRASPARRRARRGSPGTRRRTPRRGVDQPAGLAAWICATIPPTRPATVGRDFHSASVTVSPNPSFDRLLERRERVHLEGVHLDRRRRCSGWTGCRCRGRRPRR